MAWEKIAFFRSYLVTTSKAFKVDKAITWVFEHITKTVYIFSVVLCWFLYCWNKIRIVHTYLHKHLLTSGLLANLDKRKEENFFPWNISKKSEYIPISKTLKDQKFLDQIILERLSSMASWRCIWKGKLFSPQIKHMQISAVSTHRWPSQVRRNIKGHTGIFHQYVLADTSNLFQSRGAGIRWCPPITFVPGMFWELPACLHVIYETISG